MGEHWELRELCLTIRFLSTFNISFIEEENFYGSKYFKGYWINNKIYGSMAYIGMLRGN